MGVCICRFCNLWLCECAGFVMCGCVYVWVLLCVVVSMCRFCKLWFFVCVGFVMYRCMHVCVL